MRGNDILFGVLIGTMLNGAVLGIIALTTPTYEERINETYEKCTISHYLIDGDTGQEEECGRLQDETNTEYMCDNRANRCWLELKS